MVRSALVLVALLSACSRRSVPECLADQLGGLTAKAPALPRCDADERGCRSACINGDAGSCLALAYALEKRGLADGEVVMLYARVCELGYAIGCPNYAAHEWTRGGAGLSCARRIFDVSCAAEEQFACGMAGRVLVEDPASDGEVARGRAQLERSCAELHGFSCRVLAKHLEKGTFGAPDSSRVKALLAQACAGGDPDGCGDPKTAAGTFAP